MRLGLGIINGAETRVVEVEETPEARPAVVGRGGIATVLVSNPNVSTRHCLLWLDGQTWYVRDASSGLGTFVNGEGLVGAIAMGVQDGDVITLGAGEDAPRLHVAYTSEAIPPAVDANDGLDEDVEVPLEGVNEAIAEQRRYIPPPARRSTETIVLYALLATVLIAGGAWFGVRKILAMRNAQRTNAAQTRPATQPIAPVVRVTPRSTTVFDDPSQASVTRVQEGAVARMYLEPLPRRASASSNDPVLQTDAWRNVQDAQEGKGHPGQAIWIYLDFMRMNPGKFEAELQHDLDRALDRLWWLRLDELMRRRERLASDIQQKNNQIAQEDPGSDGQKTLIDQRTKLEEQQKGLLDELEQEMSFKRREAPNPSDVDAVASHRAERDPDKYSAWRRKVLQSVAEARRLPWGNW